MTILNRDYFTNALLLAATGAVLIAASALTGCSGSSGTAASLTAAGSLSSGTSADLFSAYKSLSPSDQAALVTSLRVTTFDQYYNSLLADASNAPASIDGKTISGMADFLKEHKDGFSSLAATYGNLGQLWDKVGFDPATQMTADGVGEAIASAFAFKGGSSSLGLADDDLPDPLKNTVRVIRGIGVCVDEMTKVAAKLALAAHAADNAYKTFVNNGDAQGATVYAQKAAGNLAAMQSQSKTQVDTACADQSGNASSSVNSGDSPSS